MNRLLFFNGESERFRTLLLESPLETAGIILANPVRTPIGSWRLLVSDVFLVPEDAYSRRTQFSIELKTEFVASILKRARVRKLSIFFVHSHPFTDEAHPSEIDVQGEGVLFPTVFNRVPDLPHGRIIIASKTWNGRLLDDRNKEIPFTIWDVGADVVKILTSLNEAEIEEKFDRQIRAFGAYGQRKIESVTVAIVGLGGTGSIVAQQLAHLGVKRFILIDDDVLEPTNLNRVVGSCAKDVGHSKVEVASKLIQGIRPSAEIVRIQDSVLKISVAKRLLDADMFFCCTDSHGSRAVLTQLAYQYFLPGFDIGVVIQTVEGRVTHIAGRAQMLAPGLECLACMNTLDPETVRRDFMTEAERQADPYIVGGGEPQPAVISINSTVASLAVNMFLACITGIPIKSRHQVLRAEMGVVRSILNEPVPNCIVCSTAGAFGKGDCWHLPGRQE